MPSETKETLLTKIATYGEILSADLTVMQLKGLLSELQAKARSEGQHILKDQLKELNKACKKKPLLIEFLQRLGLQPSPNMTIAQMFSMGEKHLIMNATALPADQVGFGQHAALTYSQVRLQHPGYCEWVKDIAKEGESCWRLARLAEWLESMSR